MALSSARRGGQPLEQIGALELANPGTAVVLVVEVRHGVEAKTQPRIPPRPLSGSFVNPALYLAFSASRSAFQRWPEAWQGARGRGLEGRGAQEIGHRMGQGQGGPTCGACGEGR